MFGWYISVEGLCHYIVYNFRQECDPDTNFRDIDFRKNLMKALVDRDRELDRELSCTVGPITGNICRQGGNLTRFYKLSVTGGPCTGLDSTQCRYLIFLSSQFSQSYKLSQRKPGAGLTGQAGQ